MKLFDKSVLICKHYIITLALNTLVYKTRSIPNVNNFLLYYQNVRGLRTKCNDFYVACQRHACNYDVVALTETWLNSSIYDSELFHLDFAVYRCDRTELSSAHSRGGGVLLSVRNMNEYVDFFTISYNLQLSFLFQLLLQLLTIIRRGLIK